MSQQYLDLGRLVPCENHPMSHRFNEIFDELPDETQALIEARYGKRKNRLWQLAAFALLALGLPWLMWSAWHHSNPAIRVSLVSFAPIDERSIDLTFALIRKDPATRVLCTLIARDIEKNIVGEIDLPIAPGLRTSTQITATIPTRLEAVNAGVLECRPAK